MKAVLALAFLALAKAAIIQRPFVDDALWHKNMDSLWMRHMMTMDHNAIHPYMKDFESNSFIGGNKFYKPSLVFFQTPEGKIVSYYAHDGVDKISMPEIKSAFTDLYGAADKVAMHFRPEDILGDFKTVLPGHFFEPENSFALKSFMHDMPITHDFTPLKFAGEGLVSPFKKFDIDTLPYFYKSPVTLDMTKFLSDASVFPTTHGMTMIPTTKSSFVPFGTSGIVPTVGAGVSPFFRSGLTPAYHLVKADYPFFTAAPATGFVDSTAAVTSPASSIPFIRSTSPFMTTADHALDFSPFHASGIIPSSVGAVPLVKAAPCEGCLVSDFGFSPAAGTSFRSAFPATFGAHHGMTFAPFVKSPLATSFYSDPVAFSPAHSIFPMKF